MSVRKYVRQSEGHYEKICLLPESEKYPSKSRQTVLQNDVLSKERSSPHGSNNGSSGRRSEYSASQNKGSAKPVYSNSSQRQRDSGSPSADRHSSATHSSRHSKIHNNNDDDNFEWTTHISSSGKTYYYNKRSEKSQWEKPKEWIERENKIRAREREKRNRESSIQDSRESNKYPKLSPFKKEYITSRNSPYAKRNHEHAEVERSKPVQTYGSSTSAVSTASSRSSGCPTPETTGSPIGSVQDISPPSTPSNSTVSTLSPFVNSSTTGNSITSPQLFNNSSGQYSSAQVTAHSPYLSSSHSSQNYANKYSHNEAKNPQGSSNSHGAPNTPLGGYSMAQSSSESTIVATSTAALHPLQQAMLLRQQQQQQQIAAQQSTYPMATVAHLVQSSYGQISTSPLGDIKRRSDAGPPPPPPQHFNKTATPPPPPPPNQMDGSLMVTGGYNLGRYRDPRTVNSKVTYMPAYDAMHPGMGVDNGGWDAGNQKMKVAEAPLPDLPDLTSFSQFCCKKTFEDVAGWMGCILERQAALVCNEVDSCLGLSAERTKSNLMITNLTSCIASARQQVVSSRVSCVAEVLEQVECLQDLRIERQDSKGRRKDSLADRSDSKTAHADGKAERKDSSKS